MEGLKSFFTNSNGDGNGDGYGYGYGYGNGNGYGNCYGNGYGYGYGHGIKQLNGKEVYPIDGVPTLLYSIHGQYARGATIGEGLIFTPCYIAKCGNYYAHGETLAEAVRDAQEKYMEELPTEERIALFKEVHPSKVERCPAKELYEWHHTLTGSCEYGRKEFAKLHHIDLDTDTLTVEEFIGLTVHAYGGDIIRQLAEEYDIPIP